MTHLRYTAEEIKEANERRIHCIICDNYIGDCCCPYCEEWARDEGPLLPGTTYD